MIEGVTAIMSNVDSLPVAEFFSAVIGGGFTFLGTIYTIRRRQRAKRRRLRRALVTEIESLQVGRIHNVISALRIDREGPDLVEDLIRAQAEEVLGELLTDEDVTEHIPPEDIKKIAVSEVGTSLSNINLATPIWDANRDKIGNLETDEIDSVIKFYRGVELVKHRLETTSEAANFEVNLDDDDALSWTDQTFEDQMELLLDHTEEVTSLKKEALEALNGSEFVDVKEDYLTEMDERAMERETSP